MKLPQLSDRASVVESATSSQKAASTSCVSFLLLALALGAGGVSMAHASDPDCGRTHCQPKQSPQVKPAQAAIPTTNSQAPHGPSATYSTPPPHALIKEKIPTVGPGSPGPIRSATTAPTASSTASKQGIIFVGGKNALNPQPIPPGHSAVTPSVSPAPKFNTPAPKPLPKAAPISH